MPYLPAFVGTFFEVVSYGIRVLSLLVPPDRSSPTWTISRCRPIRRSIAPCLQLEALEPRALLAQLIGIQANDGTLLEDGQVLHVAPTQLTFRFDETPPPIDPATIADNIQITRGNLDGLLGNANDVIVEPGFVGAGDSSTEAIVRFRGELAG